jgi:hypothetical protein
MRVERLYLKDTFLFGTRAIITKIGKDDHLDQYAN